MLHCVLPPAPPVLTVTVLLPLLLLLLPLSLFGAVEEVKVMATAMVVTAAVTYAVATVVLLLAVVAVKLLLLLLAGLAALLQLLPADLLADHPLLLTAVRLSLAAVQAGLSGRHEPRRTSSHSAAV